MVELSTAVEGQLLIYVFHYLQMSDLWVASYTVHRILPVHCAASEHMIQYIIYVVLKVMALKNQIQLSTQTYAVVL